MERRRVLRLEIWGWASGTSSGGLNIVRSKIPINRFVEAFHHVRADARADAFE
jgi:hypothetical protein